MTTTENIAWVAGLFEGEGSFSIANEKEPKGVKITSTDLDILEKVKSIFGGNIYKSKDVINKPHWKTKYNWLLGIEPSIEFVICILPYLLSRRTKRGIFYIKLAKENVRISSNKKFYKRERDKRIFELYFTGKTHSEIAKEFGMDRTSITKILNK